VAMATVHLRNNTIVLYKRPTSTKWQAELRYPADGSILRISTRTENEHEAAAFAIQHYEAHRIAAKPLTPKRVFGEFWLWRAKPPSLMACGSRAMKVDQSDRRGVPHDRPRTAG
jgi:hypothetical protein